MKKPGMYSDKYGKTKRRQILRRNLLLGLAALVLFLLFFIPYFGGKLYEFHANGDQFPSQTIPVRSQAQAVTSAQSTTPSATQAQTAKTETTASTQPAQATTTTTTAAAKTLTAGYSLTDGSGVIIQYEEPKAGEIQFIGVTGAEGKYTYDISPSKSQLLINETRDQNLVIIGADLKAKDHSFNTYNYGGNGQLRRDVYNKRDGFIWMRSAKFFTEDLILFESQVALAMKPMYIWSYIPSTNKFKLVEGTRATTASLIGLTEAGYEVTLDDKTVHITRTLEVIQ